MIVRQVAPERCEHTASKRKQSFNTRAASRHSITGYKQSSKSRQIFKNAKRFTLRRAVPVDGPAGEQCLEGGLAGLRALLQGLGRRRAALRLAAGVGQLADERLERGRVDDGEGLDVLDREVLAGNGKSLDYYRSIRDMKQ